MNTDKAINPDKSVLKDRFYYDETSSTGLRFNKDIYRGLGRGYKYKSFGEEAGTKMFMRNDQPHMIRVHVPEYNLVPVHRIIWILFNDDIEDGNIIDHLNGNPFDNRIENLRSIPSEENTRNAKKREDNKTGVTGVYFRKGNPPKSYPSYCAHWKENKKSRTKSFSIKRYGNKVAFEMACKHRELKIKELECSGIFYTDRHGN